MDREREREERKRKREREIKTGQNMATTICQNAARAHPSNGYIKRPNSDFLHIVREAVDTDGR